MITRQILETPRLGVTGAKGRPSDAELIACTVSAEDRTVSQAAFAHLYDRHSGAVLRFLRERVQNAPTAEDLLQEVFIRVYRKLPSLASHEHFPGWVRGICRNLLLDHRRQRVRHTSSTEQIESLPERPARTRPPSSSLAGRDLQRRIARALTKLPDSTAEMFRLRYVEDLGIQEIAQELDCEPHLVKYRLRQARERMRWLLRDAWREYAS